MSPKQILVQIHVLCNMFNIFKILFVSIKLGEMRWESNTNYGKRLDEKIPENTKACKRDIRINKKKAK